MSCIYCGSTFNIHRHHLVPCSYLGYRSYTDASNLVPACGECNTFLSDFMFSSHEERCIYLSKQYKKKYKSILNFPHWSDEELKEMSPEFRKDIKSSEALKRAVSDKLVKLIPDII